MRASRRGFYGSIVVGIVCAVCFSQAHTALAQDICEWMEEKGLVDDWMAARGLDMSINPQAGGGNVDTTTGADSADEDESKDAD